jgi:2-amino-4-hydroxy-6-hydroxymethyldihydropteridine diphosphokinase
MQGKTDFSNTVALALGSNLGDRIEALRAAALALQVFFAVDRKSFIYETPPAYVTDQPAFLNAALIGMTHLEPVELLQKLKQTEIALGRKESFRYGPRLIDIDLIFYGNRQMVTPELTLPHSRLGEREFVLRPLADIAGDWRHPISKQTIDAMLAALSEKNAQRAGNLF